MGATRKPTNTDHAPLLDVIVNSGLAEAKKKLPKNIRKDKDAVAETIENNVRKVIIEESQTNPKYYNKMSTLLDEIIRLRKNETIAYQEYLKRVNDLAQKVSEPSQGDYPPSINSRAKQALYDNLDEDAELAVQLDQVIISNKLDGWRDGGIKEKKLMLAVNKIIADPDQTLALMEIIKAQHEY